MHLIVTTFCNLVIFHYIVQILLKWKMLLFDMENVAIATLIFLFRLLLPQVSFSTFFNVEQMLLLFMTK